MKGVVFRMLEEFVIEKASPETWESLLETTPLATKEPFVGPGTYPDADFFALVKGATDRLGVPVPAAVRAFGRFCLPRLMNAVPGLTDRYRSPKELLMALDGTIHVEVRKLWRDASPPRFTCTDTGPGTLDMEYESSRGLCGFLEGLLDGTADRFGTAITWDHVACTQRGDRCCRFQMRFEAMADAAEE